MKPKESTTKSRAALVAELAEAENIYHRAAIGLRDSTATMPDVMKAKTGIELAKVALDAHDIAETDARAIAAKKQVLVDATAKKKATAKISSLLDQWAQSFSSLCEQIEELGARYKELKDLREQLSLEAKIFGHDVRMKFNARLLPPKSISEMLGDRMAVNRLSDIANDTPSFFDIESQRKYDNHQSLVEKSARNAFAELTEIAPSPQALPLPEAREPLQTQERGGVEWIAPGMGNRPATGFQADWDPHHDEAS